MTMTSLPHEQWRLLNYLRRHGATVERRRPGLVLIASGASIDDLAELADLGFVITEGGNLYDLRDLMTSPGRAGILESTTAMLALSFAGGRWVDVNPHNRLLDAIERHAAEMRGAQLGMAMVSSGTAVDHVKSATEWGLITIHAADSKPFVFDSLGDGPLVTPLYARLTDKGRQLVGD